MISGLRGFLKKVFVVDGCAGGFVIVEEDKRLGDRPIASVNIPFATKEFSHKMADFIADEINRQLVA